VERCGWLDSFKVVKRPSSLEGEVQVEEMLVVVDGVSGISFSVKLPGATVVSEGGILSSSLGASDISGSKRHDGARMRLRAIHILPSTLYTGAVLVDLSLRRG
jgi:hypothetical protein